MARSKNGEAIGPAGRTKTACERLNRFIDESAEINDIGAWRRGTAILSYIAGRRVVDIAAVLSVDRSSINRWLGWYNADGVDGLRTQYAPGRERRLSDEQIETLVKLIDAGPESSGYTSGVWTGPMIADLIDERFGVRYHNHHIPRLLHTLGFSVQRPRKRLSRADADAQDVWIRRTFPAIKKKPRPVAAL
jgi:transposase